MTAPLGILAAVATASPVPAVALVSAVARLRIAEIALEAVAHFADPQHEDPDVRAVHRIASRALERIGGGA
jgi:acetaldehyde dehydrogenase (acetylating)